MLKSYLYCERNSLGNHDSTCLSSLLKYTCLTKLSVQKFSSITVRTRAVLSMNFYALSLSKKKTNKQTNKPKTKTKNKKTWLLVNSLLYTPKF